MIHRPWLAFLLLFGLFCFTGPYDLHNRDNEAESEGKLQANIAAKGGNIEEGNASRRYAVLGLAALAFGLTRRTRARERRGESVPPDATPGYDRAVAWPIIAFLTLACASVLWADDPGIVPRRVVVLLCLAAAAWAVARAWSLPDILLFNILACLAMLVTSLALEVVRGRFQPFDGGYRLAGLTHPNNHALEAVVVIISSFFAIRLSPHRRRWYTLAAGLAVVLLLVTRSRTSVLSVILALGFAMLRTMPKRRVLGLGLLLAASVLAISVFGPGLVDSARHAALMGRDASTADIGTLTGRTELWGELLTYVAARPLLGYGLGGFWSQTHTAYIALALGWVVGHSHNGYLEVLLDLGAVGLTLFVIVLGAGITQALRRLKANPQSVEALFAVTVLVWVVIAMLSEKVFPETHYASFLVMVVLARLAVTAPAWAAARAPLPGVSVTATWRPST
jgi:exopolysaccharide production protein ExoQ